MRRVIMPQKNNILHFMFRSMVKSVAINPLIENSAIYRCQRVSVTTGAINNRGRGEE